MNELALRTIPARDEYTSAAQAERLRWLRGQCGAPLVSLDGGCLDARLLPGNLENYVASVEVPVGLAGPLLFTGERARGLVTAPLATTEGALVASASRGARAIAACGGVTTRVLSQRMTRAPAYEFADICAAAEFVAWLGVRRPAIEAAVAPVSRHARIRVDSVTAPGDLGCSGILSKLTSHGEQRKLLGLHPLRIAYTGGDGRRAELDVVAKVKALDEELLIATGKLASSCGGPVARAWASWGRYTELKDSHTRELAPYRRTRSHPALRAVLPKCFGVLEDPDREAYVVLMERLEPSCLDIRWRRPEIEAALRGIGPVHRRWLGREEVLLESGLLGQVPGAALLEEAHELWTALAEHNATEHPDLVDGATLDRLRRLADQAGSWSRELARMPRTLVHNDFNPRNLELRADGRLIAYDWELATLDIPQRDLAELLVFTLTPGAEPDEVAHYLEAHRNALDPAPDRAGWREGYRLALHEFLLTRLQMYLMAHTYHEYTFLPGVVRTAWRLWELES